MGKKSKLCPESPCHSALPRHDTFSYFGGCEHNETIGKKALAFGEFIGQSVFKRTQRNLHSRCGEVELANTTCLGTRRGGRSFCQHWMRPWRAGSSGPRASETLDVPTTFIPSRNNAQSRSQSRRFCACICLIINAFRLRHSPRSAWLTFVIVFI